MSARRADAGAPNSIASRIEALAGRNDVAGGEVLLYADIDLNVIDGSSIWLSSMASILARHRRVILVAKQNVTTDVVVANIENRERVAILEPHHFNHRRAHFDLKEAIEVIRRLDAACPGLTAVFVRGTDAADMLLADRQFHARTYAYLTDFYEVGEDGVRVSAERARQLGVIATHARRILVQTDRIAARIREVTGEDFESLELPPPIADDLPIRAPRPDSHLAPRQRIRMGYAGKIAPDWGVRELLDWTETLRAAGLDVELTIVGNKISGPKTAELRRAFREEMIRRMAEVGVIRHEQLTRAEALARMQEMDFVWCWRPGSFERGTLELSTKLVEGVASGFACICFPNETNRRLLGEDYPYFAESLEDLRRILREVAPAVPAATVAACRERHSFATLAARIDTALEGAAPKPAPRICFAGHDFKFIDPYISRLKLDGRPVTRDVWNWGSPEDPEITRSRLAAADVVFCEWGLANAVWYSRNLPPGKRLFVRIHLQEIDERAQNLTRQILPDRVERFIFVSERVRDEAVRLYGWPPEKTVVIPNFVLDDEYTLHERSFAEPIRLGMVGIVPWRKRLDRAIDLLDALQKAGHAAELHIKGPRPEATRFMHAKGRSEELLLYEAQYDRLRQNPDLDRAVTFHPEGNDVAAFYRVVDHILSPSDFESFHYSLADGILSGCHPLVWPWQGAAGTYDPDWIVGSIDAAVDRIVAFRSQAPSGRSDALARNRALVCNRYGTERVFANLTDTLFGNPYDMKYDTVAKDMVVPEGVTTSPALDPTETPPATSDRPGTGLTAEDLEILAANHVGVHRDYTARIASLTGSGFVAPGRQELPPRPFHLPFDWNADPFRDRNWMFNLHAWRMLDPHLNRLLAEPDHPRAFADILDVVADWHRANVRGRPGRFTWHDMSTGLRALRLALLIRMADHHGHSFADPGLIADLVDRHMAELSRPERLSAGNHGLFQLNGLMALAWLHPAHPRAAGARTFAIERMAALIDSQLGPSGVHTEHSPEYHFMATTWIVRILRAPWWKLEGMPPFQARLDAAKRAGTWLVDPAGRCLPVGDSTESVRVRDFAGLDAWPHRRLAGTQGATLGAAVDGYAAVRTNPAVLAARSAILFLTASFHSGGHKHSDCLSLIWQEAGENLLIDSGRYGYQRDRRRAYFLSTRAHNTIEVDGRSFSRRKAHAYGSGIRSVEPLQETWLIEAEAPHPHEGIRHRRLLFFRPHDFLLAIDHLAPGRAGSRLERLRRVVARRRTFTAWWHFNPAHAVAGEPDPSGRHLVSGLAGERRLFVSHVSSGADRRVELHRGRTWPRLQGWVSRAYRKCEPAPALGFFARSGGDFAAATLFELAGHDAPPRLALRWDAAVGRMALSREPAPEEGVRTFAVGGFSLDLPEALL